MADQNIEVVFSFDTTGSMYPCLTQVRRTLKDTVTRLFKEVPGIRIGIIAHGDYCDAGSTYVTKHFDLSNDPLAICRFVETVQPTGGGDAPECYELVLKEARTQVSWTSGKAKVLALIGDDVPHGPTYPLNGFRIDWRNELGLLLESGIAVYGVQALNRAHATQFYKEIAHKTGGFHINLDQFAHVTDMIMAVCYKQAGDDRLQTFESEVIHGSRMNRSLDRMFGTLLGRKASADYAKTDLTAVPPGRFQVMTVERDQVIRDFARDNGLGFEPGRGFYEFTKSAKIQDYKEVVLMDRRTGDLFTGARARELLDLPITGTVKIGPKGLATYIPFVQSTSYNRKLLAGTRFLYEVSDWARTGAPVEAAAPAPKPEPAPNRTFIPKPLTKVEVEDLKFMMRPVRFIAPEPVEPPRAEYAVASNERGRIYPRWIDMRVGETVLVRETAEVGEVHRKIRASISSFRTKRNKKDWRFSTKVLADGVQVQRTN